jgi:hypothetical protein
LTTRPWSRRGVKAASRSGRSFGWVSAPSNLQISARWKNGTHLSVKVECNSLVGNLHIGNLDDNLLELIMVPVGKSLSHGESRIIGFVYLSADVQVSNKGTYHSRCIGRQARAIDEPAERP